MREEYKRVVNKLDGLATQDVDEPANMADEELEIDEELEAMFDAINTGLLTIAKDANEYDSIRYFFTKAKNTYYENKVKKDGSIRYPDYMPPEKFVKYRREYRICF